MAVSVTATAANIYLASAIETGPRLSFFILFDPHSHFDRFIGK